MNKNRKSILDLNDYCKLKIIKYIIADCELDGKSQSNRMNYLDLVSFGLAHEDLEAVLIQYFNDLYEDLKFLFVENRDDLKIDFAKLQSIHRGRAGDVFWRYLADAIRENSKLEHVYLYFRSESFQHEFLDHFQMIKYALQNKRSLRHVSIVLKGYTLDDLNNFGNITNLSLKVRMCAEALVSVCKSNPELDTLIFMSRKIQGRLSDIVPHCRNLRYLKFKAKRDVDGAEYAPLVRLPNLEKMIMHGMFKTSSLLTMFETLQKCQRTKDLEIHFYADLPRFSRVTIVRNNSFRSLILIKSHRGIYLKTSYKFIEISKDTTPLEQSLATITLIGAHLEINSTKLILYQYPRSDNDISGLSSLLKVLNIETLILCRVENAPLEQIFASISKELIPLKSLVIKYDDIDQCYTRELVKIKSITSLKCTFLDWESVELLSALTNLKTVDIVVKQKFDYTFFKALCNLLNTCQDSSNIKCEDFEINCTKQDRVPGLTILKASKSGSLNVLFEVSANRDLITSEELHILHLENINLKNILKVAEVNTIRKLNISLADTSGIEKLSELTQLEELTISHTEKGSLIKLFDQLATKESPSLHSLNIKLLNLSPEEVLSVSRIKSLKELELHVSLTEDCESLSELANSNIEELSFYRQLQNYDDDDYDCKLTNVYKAFASKSVKLTDLTTAQVLCAGDLIEISRIKSLKSLILFIAPIDEDLTDLNLSELSELKTLYIEFVKGYEVDTVLAILKCCRNLHCFLTTFDIEAHKSTLKGIHTLLKSVRDPALQGPLTVVVKPVRNVDDEEIGPDTVEPFFEDAFLKVCSSKPYPLYFLYP